MVANPVYPQSNVFSFGHISDDFAYGRREHSHDSRSGNDLVFYSQLRVFKDINNLEFIIPRVPFLTDLSQVFYRSTAIGIRYLKNGETNC